MSKITILLKQQLGGGYSEIIACFFDASGSQMLLFGNFGN
jgi:hypothetical protein